MSQLLRGVGTKNTASRSCIGRRGSEFSSPPRNPWDIGESLEIWKFFPFILQKEVSLSKEICSPNLPFVIEIGPEWVDNPSRLMESFMLYMLIYTTVSIVYVRAFGEQGRQIPGREKSLIWEEIFSRDLEPNMSKKLRLTLSSDNVIKLPEVVEDIYVLEGSTKSNWQMCYIEASFEMTNLSSKSKPLEKLKFSCRGNFSRDGVSRARIVRSRLTGSWVCLRTWEISVRLRNSSPDTESGFIKGTLLGKNVVYSTPFLRIDLFGGKKEVGI